MSTTTKAERLKQGRAHAKSAAAKGKLRISSDADEIIRLTRLLRERDHDPKYADAPIVDAYSRISINLDTEEMEKTDRQLVDILNAMLRDGYRLGEILRDDNLSAWKVDGKRPDWTRLVERIEKRQTGGAYVWHTDRLLRQPYDLEVLIRAAKKGAIVASHFGDYKLQNSEHRAALRILTTMACKASDDTSRRAKRKNEALRAEGIMQKGECFGHGSAPTVAAERELIRWAMQAIVDGHSWQYCADYANDQGVLSRNGYKFNPLKLRTVLNRPRHAGYLAYGDVIVGRLHNAEEEACVSEELWRRFQAVLASRKRGRPVSREQYPLSGLAFCACGFAMIGTSQRGYKGQSRIRAYRCGSHGCQRNYVNAEKLEAWAESTMFNVLTDPKHARMIARASAALGKLDAQITALRDRETAIAAKLTDLRNDPTALLSAIDVIHAQLRELCTERDALFAETNPGRRTSRPADRASLEAEYEAADAEGRRAFLAQVFTRDRRIVVSPDRTLADRFSRAG